MYGGRSANRTNARRDGARTHLSRGPVEGGLLGKGVWVGGTLSRRGGVCVDDEWYQ